jgi:predicted TIM-barrel fold metal-dependent hydrolase
MPTDIHTHIYDEKVLGAYRKKMGDADGKGKIIVIGWRKPPLDEVLAFASRNSNVFVAAMADMEKPSRPQLAKFEKLFKEKKIVGVKMYPGYQYFYPSDKAVDQFARLCAKFDKPLIFHSGDFYDPDAKRQPLLKYSQSIHVDELAARHPRMKIIIAHFGFPNHLVTANIVYKNRNVFTDISGTIDGHVGINGLTRQYIADLKRAFNYYPDVMDKVMFGTDYGGEESDLCRVRPYLDVIRKAFPAERHRSVLEELAERLFF